MAYAIATKVEKLTINNNNTQINIGNISLPGGDGGEGIVKIILYYLDIKSLRAFVQTSMIKQLSIACGGSKYLFNLYNEIIETYRINLISQMEERYKHQYPRGTPFIVGCEKGRLKDIKLAIKTGAVVDVNMKGRDSRGWDRGYTGLMLAVQNEHMDVVQYLLSLPPIDIAVVNNSGWNVLHYAAGYNKTNTDVLNLILNHPNCNLNIINAESKQRRNPLDMTIANHTHNRSGLWQLLYDHGGLSRSEMYDHR